MSGITLPLSEACERNRGPILDALAPHFAHSRRVLEIGSGTAQHAVFFGAAMPWLDWQTSDRAEYLPGIRARLAAEAPPNVLAPLELDVKAAWPALSFDALFSANTLHIMDWPAVECLFRGIAAGLAAGGTAAIYGPFNYGGDYTSASNAAFDRSLRRRDPASGIRDVEAVHALAEEAGLMPRADHAMPANNRLLVWMRSA